MKFQVLCDKCGKPLYTSEVKTGSTCTLYSVEKLCDECKKKEEVKKEVELLE